MDGQVLMHTEEVITQDYSSNHKAIDLVGTGHSIDDVVAVNDGTVEIAVSTVTTNNTSARGTASYGNFVKIKHDDGTKSLYAHLKQGSVSVKTGDHVCAGEKIGTMGNTGNAVGVHLHFEIRQSDETRVNPIEYLANQTQAEPVKEPVNNSPNTSSQTEAKPNKTDSVNNQTTPNNANVENQTVQQNNENTITSNDSENNYLSNTSYTYGSIVDGLKGINIDSSFDYREEIAHANGITDYRGSYSQNVYLLTLLKQGKLKKA